ncbi:conjugative transposon protein TraJ [Rufibacter sp. LB8]|nr:conjugative transposon protein TraJ [Rufibacter sp. LB8]
MLQAQGMAEGMQGMHGVLDQVYREMLPLCEGLMAAGRGIAGFAALWYIGSRVWGHIASAEPIDFYPLLRPFALGMAILLFPAVLALLNGVLSPTVAATSAMVGASDKAVAELLRQKEEAVRESEAHGMYVGEDGKGDSDAWYRYTHPEDPEREEEGVMEKVSNSVRFAMEKASYNFRNSIKQWMSEVLQVLFMAASLCINTIRTFYLLVLAILGPLVFAFAVFDGFQHTLSQWLARYVNVFLWLPVSNIFGCIIGKVQENMLKLDIGQINEAGDTFFSPMDTAYLIFMVIGIVGYLTVPNVANYVVYAGGGNALVQKVSLLLASTGSAAASGAAHMVHGTGSFLHGEGGSHGTGAPPGTQGTSQREYNPGQR